jgi:TolB-like protein/class 3 adenylate cyclase
MKQPVERRLAAILAADVAGYSRLMGADEEGTLERLKAHRRQLIHPKVQEHHGRIVKTTGDGMLVEFPSVVDAVRCAVEVQRAMLDPNTETPEDKRIAFRIGINLGDVIIDGGDIYGDGVNIAARLEALAEPGGVCISRVVRDQIRDKLPYPFEDMGGQTVKNIARPVRAYSMSAATVASTPLVAAPARVRRARGLRRVIIPASAIALLCVVFAAWWSWPKGPPSTTAIPQPAAQIAAAAPNTPAPRLSIVVLPFNNLSNDPDQEYFADGITDDLTTDMSRISGSFVIARNTAFTYKGKSVDAKQIGRELGVRYVLEGSVRRTGDQVRVNVQLIDAESGAHIWADRFDTDRANLAAAQDEITGRLARTLDLEIVQAAALRIGEEADPDARDLVMRGRALWSRPFSPENAQEAMQAFERALETDPRSIGARIGIGRILAGKVLDGFSTSAEQDRTRAEGLLLEVLAREANDSMAHAVMGLVRRSDNRFAEARSELETAISLDRNNAFAFRQLGLTMSFLGQPELTIQYIEKALRISPREALMPSYLFIGLSYLFVGRTDEAMGSLRKARAQNFHIWYVRLTLAGALGLMGDLEEAHGEIVEALKLKPEITSIVKMAGLPDDDGACICAVAGAHGKNRVCRPPPRRIPGGLTPAHTFNAFAGAAQSRRGDRRGARLRRGAATGPRDWRRSASR